MTQAGLTEQQQRAFDAICRYQAAHGRTPSTREICAALGLRSKSGAARLIMALEERGYITRLANRARSIAIVVPPTPAAAPLTAMSRSLQARLEAYCRVTGESVEAIIHDAVALYLDEEDGAVAA